MKWKWFNDLQRTSTTGEVAAQLEAAMHDVDVSELAQVIEVPTLVMHCADDVAVPFEEGRRLASLIPNARFVTLPGAYHIVLERDPAWPEFVAEINQFTEAARR